MIVFEGVNENVISNYDQKNDYGWRFRHKNKPTMNFIPHVVSRAIIPHNNPQLSSHKDP